MMELNEGSRIRLIGVPKYEDKVFSVTELRHGLAVCEGEDGTLLLPVNDALSFGILVLKEQEAEAAPASADTEPAAVPEAEPQAPAEAVPASPARPFKPFTYEEGKEYRGKVIYWQGHWGKIGHPELHSGIFFHVSMIGDDDLLTVLNAPKGSFPEVTYTIGRNPRRTTGFCAMNIRLARDEAEEDELDDLGEIPEGLDEEATAPAEQETEEQAVPQEDAQADAGAPASGQTEEN